MQAPEGYKQFGSLSAEEQNELFQYWVHKRTIEFYHPNCGWVGMADPDWFLNRCYRKPIVKPSVDWDHLSPDIVAIATDMCGYSYGYTQKPRLDATRWNINSGTAMLVDYLASFNKGNCSWEESLILRPEKINAYPYNLV